MNENKVNPPNAFTDLLQGEHPVSKEYTELNRRLRAEKSSIEDDEMFSTKTWHEDYKSLYFGAKALLLIGNVVSIALSIVFVATILSAVGLPTEISYIIAIVFLCALEFGVKNTLITKATHQYENGQVGLSRNTAIVLAVVIIASGALTVGGGGQVPALMTQIVPLPTGITSGNASPYTKEEIVAKIKAAEEEKATILSQRAQRAKETGKVSWYGTEQEKQLNTAIQSYEAKLANATAKAEHDEQSQYATSKAQNNAYLIKIYALLDEILVLFCCAFCAYYTRRRYFERKILARQGSHGSAQGSQQYEYQYANTERQPRPYPTNAPQAKQHRKLPPADPPTDNNNNQDANEQPLPHQSNTVNNSVYTRIYDLSDPQILDLFGKWKIDMRDIAVYQNKLSNGVGNESTNAGRLSEATQSLQATEAKLAARGVGVKKEANKYVLYGLDATEAG